MFEAHIVSPRGSLYFAAEATPYDLETLRQYLGDFARVSPARDVHLELTIAGGEAVAPCVCAWLRQVTDAGVRVKYVEPAQADPA